MPAASKNNNKPPTGKNGADGNKRQGPATGPIYDGPADTASGPSGGQGGANAPGPVQPMRRDPGREPVVNKNIDLPGSAYNLFNQYDVPTDLIRRPGFNSTGVAATVAINSYPILKFPSKSVYQYDIHIGTGVEKRGLIKTVWESQQLKKRINHTWIYDGNKIAWSLQDIGDVNFSVDLDAEKGIPAREGRSNSHRVSIRKTTAVNLYAVQAYLDGKMTFDNSVLQAINFLDHLMRESPSKHPDMIAFRRSFFHKNITERMQIGNGVEALKGVYQSIRAAQGGRLVINVDVSNSTFWTPGTLTTVAYQNANAPDILHLAMACKKTQKTSHSPLTDHSYMIHLKKLQKVGFRVQYRNCSEAMLKKSFIIKKFSYLNAHTWKFEQTDKTTGTVRTMSIFEYFKEKYNCHLQFPTIPIVETTKKGVAFPMEVCYVLHGQRFPFKLNELQTQKMIKFAVGRPEERKRGITSGLQLLDWAGDKYLKGYQMKVQDKMLETAARVLAPPAIEFGMKKLEKPMYTGRWRLDGKQFYTPNKEPLVAWGVCVCNDLGRDSVNKVQAENFIRAFVNAYKGHGGNVRNPNPIYTSLGPDLGKTIEEFYAKIGNTYKIRPQMIVFMLGGKDSFAYLRIKKSTDCRWGVVSQCMQNAHIIKCAPQYISNVLMKFNAKLGGVTARVATKNPMGHFTRPTIIIGADVSHASPGSLQPSTAAFTVSMNPHCTRYAAAVETNGHRVEMITTYNMENMLTPLFREWMTEAGKGRFPAHVFYMRDGVSEGQYQHVLQQEIRDLRKIWVGLASENKALIEAAMKIHFTVIVCSKRHHIRFFPVGRPAADTNGNPVPGVIVEKDVTHPFEYDFYLNSHSAIQGTARPTHYHVLMDESNMPPNELHNMIYEQCYQYIRSTTPVSLHPAVYYAHLASNRAKAHEDIAASQGPHTSTEQRKEKERIEKRENMIAQAQAKGLPPPSTTASSDRPPTETKPLIKMCNEGRIRYAMWYI